MVCMVCVIAFQQINFLSPYGNKNQSFKGYSRRVLQPKTVVLKRAWRVKYFLGKKQFLLGLLAHFWCSSAFFRTHGLRHFHPRLRLCFGPPLWRLQRVCACGRGALSPWSRAGRGNDSVIKRPSFLREPSLIRIIPLQ